MGTPVDAFVDLDRRPVLDTGWTAFRALAEDARGHHPVGEGTAYLEFPDCSLPTVHEALGCRDLDSRYLPPGIT
ncbi:MAG TPA: hypothetical protein VII96_03120 [Acidimicrobiales bacterium]